MKGFMKRDLYLMLPNLRFYALFLLLIGALSVFQIADSMVSFFGFYVTIFASSCILGLFSYDEVNHWQGYAAAAPDGRRRQVDGRYAVALLMGVGLTVTWALPFLLSRAFGDLPAALLYGGVFLIYLDLAIPIGYRFGNSSRMVMIILIALIGAAGGMGGAVLSISSPKGIFGVSLPLGLALVGMGLVGMVLSRKVSVKIMEEKSL